MYLSEQEVGALASDLSAVIGFDHWELELQSPGLLRMVQKRMGGPLREANVLPKFAPNAEPHFFEPLTAPPLDGNASPPPSAARRSLDSSRSPDAS